MNCWLGLFIRHPSIFILEGNNPLAKFLAIHFIWMGGHNRKNGGFWEKLAEMILETKAIILLLVGRGGNGWKGGKE